MNTKKGYKLSLETRHKMSLSRKGSKNSFFGKHHSKETKDKISASKKGNVSWNKGIPMSKSAKIKLSKSLKGRPANKTSFKKGHIPWHKGKSNIYDKQVIKKMSATRKGQWVKDKNPNWKGGITPLVKTIRTSFKYAEWRKEVFERDNWICQKCGQHSGILNVHHVIKFSNIIKNKKIKTIEEALACYDLWDLNNGITLCKSCHLKEHRKLKVGLY